MSMTFASASPGRRKRPLHRAPRAVAVAVARQSRGALRARRERRASPLQPAQL